MNRFEQKVGEYKLVVDKDVLPPNPRNGKNRWKLLLSYKGKVVNEIQEQVSDFNNLAPLYDELKKRYRIVTGVYLNHGEGKGFKIANMPEEGSFELIGFAMLDDINKSLTISEYISQVAVANGVLAKELHDLQACLDKDAYGFTIYDSTGTHVLSRWGYYSKGQCIKEGRQEIQNEISKNIWIVQDRLPVYSAY